MAAGVKHIDYNGIEYKSLSAMLREYNLPKHIYKKRVELGWDIERILTTPCFEVREECIDHTGRPFKSIQEMCKYHKVHITTYLARLKQGYSKEYALTHRQEFKVRDYNNKEFETVSKMCEYHGVNRTTYDTRIKAGKSLRDALNPNLDRDMNKFDKIFSRHLIFGHRYNSVDELALQYKIPDSKIRNRFKNTCSNNYMDIEILVTVPNISRYNLKFVGLDRQARYQVPWSKEYQTTRQIIQHERPDLLELYDKAHPKGEWNPYRREGD